MTKELTLLGRSYCHLCEDMEVAVASIAAEFGATVHVVDVDSDPELEAQYGEMVPVLLLGDRELCHYWLDETKVRECLGGIH